jgi:hypothetical protein
MEVEVAASSPFVGKECLVGKGERVTSEIEVRYRSAERRTEQKQGDKEANGRAEGWKGGRVEGWKNGRMQGWKIGRIEDWKAG